METDKTKSFKKFEEIKEQVPGNGRTLICDVLFPDGTIVPECSLDSVYGPAANATKPTIFLKVKLYGLDIPSISEAYIQSLEFRIKQ